ncbi:TonB-dependent receptor [soil metagenome]
MRRSLSYIAAFLMANIICIAAMAQSRTITGSVKNSVTGEGVASVSITVNGSGAGTYTDQNGNFKLITIQKPPLTITISSVGFNMQSVTVSGNENVKVSLTPSNSLGQEVVVSATRTPQRILESPVTIERISSAAIRNSAAPSYYDIIGNLKGVDMVTASLNFKSPSTRGFNGSGNLRLNQIMDGMDNQAPGLNFSVGSIVGLTELDVESVELLPGASSALYGPGGMNGALLINSKNPFKYQGLSFNVKTGIMHLDDPQRSTSPYYNWTLRWAKKISEKFAFKIGSELIQAKDWVASDYRNYNRLSTTGGVTAGNRQTDPNYEGVNVYGDETTVNIVPFLQGIGAQAPFLNPFINTLIKNPINVSRTGYNERDIIDPTTLNVKLSGSLNYKITPSTEVIGAAYWGTGNTVYTGSDRYSLKNLKMGQYKLEINNPNWFLRGYTTRENAGESFNATVTTRLTNEAWKKSVTTTALGVPTPQASDWYVQYTQAYLNFKLQGMSDMDAHNAARGLADVGRPAAGSAAFKKIFDQVRSIPISKGGGLFVDKTNLYNIEGQYNLSKFTGNFADILIGANYKKYVLNSEGTLFADSAGTIPINEYGAYAQLTRKLVDRVKLTLSGRYDKNTNFEGKFTPRISAVIKVAEDNNVRLSYQSAYRFPSTQQQWINLKVGTGTRLLGGVQSLQDFYHFNTNKVYALDTTQLYAGTPREQKFDKFKAETLNSFEAGYKGLLVNKKLLVDVYGYYGVYKNFVVRQLVVQSVSGNASVFTDVNSVRGNLRNDQVVNTYSVPTNLSGDVKTYGFGAGLDYALGRNYSIGINASSDNLKDVPTGYIAQFNSPKYRFAANFGNTGFGKNKAAMFNIAYRWQDDVDYVGDFGAGTVPAYHTLDGQVGYKFIPEKILLKVGATNLLNQYYRNGFGNANIGGLYYVSVGYNLF